MEWTFFTVLVLVASVSTEIPPSSSNETKAEETTSLPETTVMNNVKSPVTELVTHDESNSTLSLKTTTPLPPSTNDSKLSPTKSHDDRPTMEGVGTTSTKPIILQTTTDAPSPTPNVTTTTTTTSTTSQQQHHGKKELEEDFTPSVPSIQYYSSPLPIDTINHQFVDVPVPKDIGDVTQVEVPSSSKSSLLAGLIFGSLISLALGFLIYKRLDSARRRREYRRMNDYLIDGMYNDI